MLRYDRSFKTFYSILRYEVCLNWKYLSNYQKRDELLDFVKFQIQLIFQVVKNT
jgi:hypothetical protein